MFSRYRLTVVPWLWLTTRNGHNRVFQEKSAVEIIDAVFSEFSQVAAWRWSDEVAQFMADMRAIAHPLQRQG